MNLKLTLVALLCYLSSFAQFLQEQYLPTPDKVNYFNFGPFIEPTISYGATPSNYNGKVLFFNQGYLDAMETQFLIDNKFYEIAYEKGYQTVFVNTTRGGGVWTNSSIIANALDIVTEKLGVESVFYIGHSNGAKAGDVAMTLLGKKDKVAKIFALGTPFYGTKLADIAESPFLGWIWDMIGFSEGSATSTRAYCTRLRNQVLDPHPDNQPEKFVVLGASGFYRGQTIGNAMFQISGRILGGRRVPNDGVAPYYSTLRPGADHVFRRNDNRAIFDHWDVSLGQVVWPDIEPYIENCNYVNDRSETKSTENLIDQSVETSDYFLAYSENAYDNTIELDKNSQSATIEIIHEDKSASFELSSKGAIVTKGAFSNTHNTILEVNQSNLKLNTNSKYIAFVRPNNGIEMTVKKIDENTSYPIIKTSFNTKTSKSTKVIGIVTRITSLDATEERSEPMVIEFIQENGEYILNTTDLKDGVYNIIINGNSKGEFKRSLITGFIVGNMKTAVENISSNHTTHTDNTITYQEKLILYPTLVKNEAHIKINSNQTSRVYEAAIYAIDGRLVTSFTLEARTQQNNIDLSHHIHSLQKGIYVMQIAGIGTSKFIKQ